MFDWLFESISTLLSVFYDMTGSIGLSIVLLTLVVMLVTFPLTMKGTRSQMRMQKYLPEMQRIQKQHKNDREKLNQEMMAFYQREGLNPLAPVSGCLLLLVQMPVFLILYRILSGLSHADGPKYIPETSKLYDDIVAESGKLLSFGLDLAKSATTIGGGVGKSWPYWVLVALVGATAYVQQKQLMGRRVNPSQQVNPQMQMVTKIMPFMLPLISVNLPAGVVVYFLVSNLFRVGQQEIIWRLEQRANGEAGGTSAAGRKGASSGGKGTAAVIEAESSEAPGKAKAEPPNPPKPSPAKGSSPRGQQRPGSPSGSQQRPSSRSRKKRKRRR